MALDRMFHACACAVGCLGTAPSMAAVMRGCKGVFALQGLTAEQVLAQYHTMPDQDNSLNAQHILAGQHMHMQPGTGDGQQ